MTDDGIDRRYGFSQSSCELLRHVGVGRAVEAVSSHTMVVVQMLGQGVSVTFGGHARRVKCCVGHDDVRDVAPRVAREADAEGVRRVVERG